MKAPKAEEEKVDKLPPLAPSSWSGRRNQQAYSSNRNRRQNSKTPTSLGQTDTSDQSDDNRSTDSHQLSVDKNQARNNFYLNNNDLNIQESGKQRMG